MVAITGANGLVGSHIARLLLSQGETVRLLVRNPNDCNLDPFRSNTEIVAADVLDVLGLQKALEGVDSVIHTAAIVSFWRKKHPEMLTTNVEGTNNVVNISLQMGIQRLVHISSIAALGRSETTNGMLDENNIWVNSSQNSMYARSKYKAELAVLRGVEEGLNAVIVNPGVIFGFSDWNRSSSNVFRKMAHGRRLYPPGGNGFVSANDVAKAAVILAGRKDLTGERFILVSENLSYKRVFELIAKAFNNTPPSIELPPKLVLLAGFLSEVISFITQKEPIVSLESAKTIGNTYQYNNNKITKATGFIFEPIESVINNLVPQFIEKYGLNR